MLALIGQDRSPRTMLALAWLFSEDLDEWMGTVYSHWRQLTDSEKTAIAHIQKTSKKRDGIHGALSFLREDAAIDSIIHVAQYLHSQKRAS